MRVTQFTRANAGQHSIERVFHGIRAALPGNIECDTLSCRFQGGVLGRIWNMIAAASHGSDVNHIVGDVHYLALALPGRRTLLTVHDCRSMQGLTGWKRGLYRRIWLEWPARRCAIITVVSEKTKTELLRYASVPSDKVVIVPNPVPPEFGYCPRPFPTGCPRILQVGTADNKNLERIIRALAGVDCELDIVGPLSVAQRRSLAACPVPFRHANSLADGELVRRYEDSDIVIFASTYEGFGMPILEAQAIGRPLITSDLSPMREVAGRGACLVNPYDVESIRAGVLRVIYETNYRRELVAYGLTNTHRFAVAEIAAQYGRIYERLATQKVERARGRPETGVGSGRP